MNFSTKLLALGCIIAITSPIAAPFVDGIAFAKDGARKSIKQKRRIRVKIPSALFKRDTTSEDCPCNGGPVCVGSRGGRYCITSGGKKRYGV